MTDTIYYISHTSRSGTPMVRVAVDSATFGEIVRSGRWMRSIQNGRATYLLMTQKTFQALTERFGWAVKESVEEFRRRAVRPSVQHISQPTKKRWNQGKRAAPGLTDFGTEAIMFPDSEMDQNSSADS